MSLGIGLSGIGIGAGGGGVRPLDYGIIIAGHQSNMTGGQMAATGATIIAADDPNANIFQYSPNGGTAAGDPVHTRVLELAIEPLRYPSGVSIDANVGPALTYAKDVLASGRYRNVVIIPGGKGGTPLTDWVTGQPLFDSIVTAYNQLIGELAALGKTYRLDSVIMSPLENEMTGGATPSNVATRIDNTVASYRALTGAANVPIYFGAAAPDYVVGNAPYLAILLEGAKAATRIANLGVIGGYTGGSTPGDTVHYTNVANRARGHKLYGLRARTAAWQSAAPPAISVISLNSQLLTFTGTGAPWYTIHVGTVGQAVPYGDAGTDFVPNAHNEAGEVYTMTLPGAGNRDAYVVAHGYAGDSAPSPVVNYTASGASVPARVIELDFANATMNGANIVSVPSSGTDTTAWTPVSTLGTADAAVIVRDTLNSIPIANLLNANKRFRRGGGFEFPAGDYSFGFPMYLPSPAPGTGTLVAWGQASTSGDIYISLANTGTNIKCQNNTTASAVITTGAPLSGQYNKYHYVGVTYDRTANIFKIYLNDVEQAISGTPNLRSATPVNSGGTDILGFNIDSANNGMICKLMPIRYWSQVITQAEFAADRAALETTYGITFG